MHRRIRPAFLRVQPAILLVCAFAWSACSAPPKSWLRYEPVGDHPWTVQKDGLLRTSLHGVPVQADLNKKDTRVEVVVANDTRSDVVFRIGPEATSELTAAIGEVQRRPLGKGHGEDVADFVPYLSQQDFQVPAGYRATFYLDSPLGRDPVLGQYFVLVVEAVDAGGGKQRKLLPLVATNAGPVARDGR